MHVAASAMSAEESRSKVDVVFGVPLQNQRAYEYEDSEGDQWVSGGSDGSVIH